jgi:hypothetical protein
MPDVEQFYQQHKYQVWLGAGGIGVLLFLVVRSRQSGTSSNHATLDTLHTDLTNIDKRLQAENSFLSSAGGMSPLEHGIDIIDFSSPEYSSTTSPAPTKAPATTTNTPRGGPGYKPPPYIPSPPSGKAPGAPQSPPRIPATGAKGSGVNDDDYETGRGPGDFSFAYSSLGSFGYGGDANDYWGLN